MLSEAASNLKFIQSKVQEINAAIVEAGEKGCPKDDRNDLEKFEKSYPLIDIGACRLDPFKNPFFPGAGSVPPELVRRDPILGSTRDEVGAGLNEIDDARCADHAYVNSLYIAWA
jgi:hypothetical protein